MNRNKMNNYYEKDKFKNPNTEIRNVLLIDSFLPEEIEFIRNKSINIDNLKSKWSWLYENPSYAEDFFIFVVLPYFIAKPQLNNWELKKLCLSPFKYALKSYRDKFDSNFYTFGQLKRKYGNFNFSDLCRLIGEDKAKQKVNHAKKRIKDILGSDSPKIKKIRVYLRELDWDKDIDWTIFKFINKNRTDMIILEPKNTCSEENPLYMHKEWLTRIYRDENLHLNDPQIAQICGVNHSAIYKWRKRFGIQTKPDVQIKELKRKNSAGYVEKFMPMEYNHPNINKKYGERQKRREHVAIMENFLSNISQSESYIRFGLYPDEIKEKYLLSDRYLKKECVVHHINFIKSDNRINNLWPYENNQKHNELIDNLNKCFSFLIKVGQIFFENGKYYLNERCDYRKIPKEKLKELLKSHYKPNPYKNLKDVKNALIDKNIINWDEILADLQDWRIEYKVNQYKSFIIELNPYNYPSENNPLYMKKEWLETVYNDERFNLSDSRLAKICGVPKTRITDWRGNFGIEGGWKRWLRIINEGFVWILVPVNYNPNAYKRDGRMLEHRYLIERYLSRCCSEEIKSKYLEDGKYLKNGIIVHHINFDTLDNRLKNLWIFKSRSDHLSCHHSLYKLIDKLLKKNFLIFRKGRYLINYRKKKYHK
ncbi:MAG: helix-turn-helix domain-containing protein [Promethearchaeati archaeon]